MKLEPIRYRTKKENKLTIHVELQHVEFQELSRKRLGTLHQSEQNWG
jgi:hypothetical protein